jgi:predicted Ser/Thr protein kinase
VLNERDVIVLKLALERSVLDASTYLKTLELLQKGERLALCLRGVGVSGPVVGELVNAADVQAETGAVLTRCDAENTLMRRFLQSSGVTPIQLEHADRELAQLALQGQFCSVDEVFVNRGWLPLLTAVALRKRVKERLATCQGCWRHFLLQPGTRKVRCPACKRVVCAGDGVSATDACRQLLTESQQQAAAQSGVVRLPPPGTGAFPAATLTTTGAPSAAPTPRPALTATRSRVPRPSVAATAAQGPPALDADTGTGRIAAAKVTAERAASALAPSQVEVPTSTDSKPGRAGQSNRLPEVQLPGVPGMPSHSSLADTASGSSDDALQTAADFDEDSIVAEEESLTASEVAVARFGSYEVLAEVARGAMGVVYKARRAGVDKVVALKVLMAGERATPKQVARFEREAAAVRRFQHPGIVRIEETGAHQGFHYIAMEFVEGETLERMIKAGPRDPTASARVISAVADAVECIHRGGVVHRDLKPGNVIVDTSGQPKLIDFGLAKVVQEEKLTRSGVMVGTPFYMAPEQVRGQGEKVGPASDVYALGAILFELVTGRQPFVGTNYGELFAAIVNTEPTPPTALRPDLPPALEAIVLRCLRKEPEERYASAAALREDLERFLAGARTSAATRGAVRGLTRTARRAVMALLALAVVMWVALLGHWVLRRPPDDAQVERLVREAREHMAAGKLGPAGRVLTAARELDRSRADVAALLGRCLVADDEVDDGLKQLEEAVRLGWTDPALFDAPELVPVKDDPRVRALRERLGQR